MACTVGRRAFPSSGWLAAYEEEVVRMEQLIKGRTGRFGRYMEEFNGCGSCMVSRKAWEEASEEGEITAELRGGRRREGAGIDRFLSPLYAPG